MKERVSIFISLKKVEEYKGKGMVAEDQEGHIYELGAVPSANGIHHLVLEKNNQPIAKIGIKDQLRNDSKSTIEYLKENEMSAHLLSGDQTPKVADVAQALGIVHYHAQQKPQQKLDIIEALSHQQPTAMIGDGINDAPALAKATIGVSLSGASKVAIQSAQIILLNNRLGSLKDAIGISKATLTTIKQNLFWAFAYNIVAIPMAAMGFLSPIWAALFMAFSDVIVIGNSLRLKSKVL